MRVVALSSLIAFTFATPALALYDGKPAAELREAPGAWRGTLKYNDYSQPGKMVTLKTAAFISMIAPNELAVFYVFDDGPGKTVYSYEQARFDFANGEVRWTSGSEKKEVTVSHIDSNEEIDGGRRIVFDAPSKGHRDQQTLMITATAFILRKDEIDPLGHSTLRDEYRFQRNGG